MMSILEQLRKDREKLRAEGRSLALRIQEEVEIEQSRKRAEKRDQKLSARRAIWNDTEKMKRELRRVGILLARYMKRDGASNAEIEGATGVSMATISAWRRRSKYEEECALNGIQEDI